MAEETDVTFCYGEIAHEKNIIQEQSKIAWQVRMLTGDPLSSQQSFFSFCTAPMGVFLCTSLAMEFDGSSQQLDVVCRFAFYFEKPKAEVAFSLLAPAPLCRREGASVSPGEAVQPQLVSGHDRSEDGARPQSVMD
ncbi:Hypothetical protein SMAX5B_011089 [Scophthalmus maximus]|uniref:Uncharacterized protein n=1 Tax=Scophthalmus maximus TaxID=52904 RepID=A0A2U9D4K9_SCOMX|nr:Hypothetical protein SMAX5B_011089 [Scophthalmus maximus]KAF0024647.1 hypothetical protein F2P81_023449 [Scophthalmus maximus]